MIPLRLTLEGKLDLPGASDRDLERAVWAMASSDGPTFIILTDSEGGFMRALGSDGRYAIEGKEVFAERALRWRAGALDDFDATETSVRFFKVCPHGIYLQRQCPYTVRATEILGINDVDMILSAYHSHHRLHLGYAWRITEGEPRLWNCQSASECHLL